MKTAVKKTGSPVCSCELSKGSPQISTFLQSSWHINLLFPVFLFFLPALLTAQDEDPFFFHSEIQGVKVYYKIMDAEPVVDLPDRVDPVESTGMEPPVLSVVKLKLENTNDYSVKAEWNNQLKSAYDGGTASLELSPGEAAFTTEANSPEVRLSVKAGDGYPVSLVEAMEHLKINIIIL